MLPSLAALLLLAFPDMTPPTSLPASQVGTSAPAASEAAIVTSTEGAWIFWMDERRDRALGQTGTPRADLWMTRVQSNGVPLSPIGTLACAAPPATTFSKPRAVMTKNGPVVAWVGQAETTSTPELFAAPMRPDGGVVCPTSPFTEPEPLRSFALGSDGESLLAAWGTPSLVRGRLLNAYGGPLDAGAYELSTPGASSPVAVAGVDGGFLVGWISSMGGAALVRRGEPGATVFDLGPNSRLGLVHRVAGPVAGLMAGAGDLDVVPLDRSGSSAVTPGAFLGGVGDFLMAPLEADNVLVLGIADGGEWFFAAGAPERPTEIRTGNLPTGHRPLALSRSVGGALAVTQVLGRAQAPLATLALPFSAASTLQWDGGAVITATKDQFSPSVCWAGGGWLVTWDEAKQPFSLGVVTHAGALTTAGQLTALADLSLPNAESLGLVSDGARMAAIGKTQGGTSLVALELDPGATSVAVGSTLADAPGPFRRAALGATDALQWTDANGGGFGAQLTVPNTSPQGLSYFGVPGRCAAVLGRRFYLPVSSDGFVDLLRFDGDAPQAAASSALRVMAPGARAACAAANGADVLFAWSTPTGIVANKFDSTTSAGLPIRLANTDVGDQDPVVAAVTGGWVLVWESGTASGTHELRGAFISSAGVVDDMSTQLGLGTVFEERQPWLAASPFGQAALTWSAFDRAKGVTRTMVRVIGDARTPDAGTPDAGAPDAGAPDAGAPDAGPVDGGTPDEDAGLPGGDGGPLRFTSCACGATPAAPALLGLLLALTTRRRRLGT